MIDYSCMKAKRLFLILSIFSFIPLSAIAQDYIPDPDIQIEEFKEIDRQRAEEEAEQEELEDAESDDSGSELSESQIATEERGSTDTKQAKKKGKIRSIYEDFTKKSSEVNGRQRITGSQLVGDFITDKLPLKLDLGTEPGEHGSTAFGVLQYDWNDKNASRLRLEYASVKTNTDSSNSIESTAQSQYDYASWITIMKSRQIEADLYPYLRYFGDESTDAKTPFFYFGIGGFYMFNWYDYSYSGWLEKGTQKAIVKIDVDGHYHQTGPMVIGSIKFPFFNYFGVALEATVSPINLVVQKYKSKQSAYTVDTQSGQGASQEISAPYTETSNWCSPLIKINMAVDALTYFRIRLGFGYSRIYIEDTKNLDLSTAQNTQETYKLRYGAEIVFPSSNNTRKKDVHLWAGLYYEHQWDIETNSDDVSRNHTGKWILCFGT